MSDPYAERLRRTAAALGTAGLDGFVVTPGPDLRYLVGHAPPPLERLTALVVRPDAQPVMLVPRLERPAAEAAPGRAAVVIESWADGDDPYAAAAALLAPGTYAISDAAWGAHVLGLQAALPGIRLVAAGAALPLRRAVKDDLELGLLASAGAAADAVFAEIVDRPFEGRTERDVAADLASLLRERGHERVDFTIVASGPNGASPHHEATDRTVAAGDAVVMDFGGFRRGYGSDITRTVVVGRPPEGFDEVYEVVRRAQQAAIESVRPGVACEDVDAAAREVIAQAGYGERFLHRTGHGIGLEIHEEPYLVTGNRTPLEPGMAFSIEPGIYLEGRFGVRIEDIVAVTEDGARRLNAAPRNAILVA